MGEPRAQEEKEEGTGERRAADGDAGGGRRNKRRVQRKGCALRHNNVSPETSRSRPARVDIYACGPGPRALGRRSAGRPPVGRSA